MYPAVSRTHHSNIISASSLAASRLPAARRCSSASTKSWSANVSGLLWSNRTPHGTRYARNSFGARAIGRVLGSALPTPQSDSPL